MIKLDGSCDRSVAGSAESDWRVTLSFISVSARHVTGDFHSVVQDPADAQDIGLRNPVEQNLSRFTDAAFSIASTIAAMAQVTAAHTEPQLRTRDTPRTVWVD